MCYPSCYRSILRNIGIALAIIGVVFLLVSIIFVIVICTGCFGKTKNQQALVHPAEGTHTVTDSSTVSPFSG